MSVLSKILRDAGHTVSKAAEDTFQEIERSPRNIQRLVMATAGGLGLAGRRGGGGRTARGGREGFPEGPPIGQEMPAPYIPPDAIPDVPGGVPGAYDDLEMPAGVGDLLDAVRAGDLSSCAAAGLKPWTIESTVVIAAGVLAADVDLGATTNPFANANSAFFTTAGVFPQPFLSYAIGGMISATQPIAATENYARLDSLYMSMRATTELARYSLTRDLGFGIGKEGNTAAAAGTGTSVTGPLPYRRWGQYFSPRTTYVWGARLPRAVTTVAAVEYTLTLRGFLFEGGASNRAMGVPGRFR